MCGTCDGPWNWRPRERGASSRIRWWAALSPGRGDHRRRMARAVRRAACRSRGLALAGRGRPGPMYVTLEPCCHFGKTPPCTKAVLAAGVKPRGRRHAGPVSRKSRAAGWPSCGARRGGGIRRAGDRGPAVERAVSETGRDRPAVDHRQMGHVAGRQNGDCQGESRWISNEKSREAVHKLRGRMDAIIVGRETALRDDPLLTARPAGPRTALRMVLDTQASLSPESQLVRTAAEAPVLVAVGRRRRRRIAAGWATPVARCSSAPGETHIDRLHAAFGGIGAAADDQRAGRRRRPGIRIVFGRAADRRSARVYRAEVDRRVAGHDSVCRQGHRANGARHYASMRPRSKQIGGDVYMFADG